MANFDDFFNVKPVVQETQTQQLIEFRPNPKKGQNGVFKAVVRFLPNPADPANKSIISKYAIYMKHPVSQVGMNLDCPSTVGAPDPIQNTFFALRNSANPVLQENSKLFSRKQKYASYIQVISCESMPTLVNKILVWNYGTKIHEKLMAEMNPPMGEPKNPFNLITGRPFSVNVKEVAGFPNYDGCGFFDLDVSQSGMRVMVANAQGQQVPNVVTLQTIQSEQGKAMVVNYIKENAPAIEPYEYHPWTVEQTNFVNECIQIYSNPQATIQAMSAAQNPGTTPVASQPAFAQAAAQPQLQMPTMGANTQPFTGPAAAPQMPVNDFAMPQMGLGASAVTATSPSGFQTPQLNADVDALLNGGEKKPAASAPSMGLDLADVLNGQMY